jgi:hypothetical protein
VITSLPIQTWSMSRSWWYKSANITDGSQMEHGHRGTGTLQASFCDSPPGWRGGPTLSMPAGIPVWTIPWEAFEFVSESKHSLEILKEVWRSWTGSPGPAIILLRLWWKWSHSSVLNFCHFKENILKLQCCRTTRKEIDRQHCVSMHFQVFWECPVCFCWLNEGSHKSRQGLASPKWRFCIW